eukprot:PhM_4_TR7756/c0_g1_i2/m.98380
MYRQPQQPLRPNNNSNVPSSHTSTRSHHDVTAATQSVASILNHHQRTSQGTPRPRYADPSSSVVQSPNTSCVTERPPSPRVHAAMFNAQRGLLDSLSRDSEDRISAMREGHRREVAALTDTLTQEQKRCARMELELRVVQSQLSALMEANEEAEAENAQLQQTLEASKERYSVIAAQWEASQKQGSAPPQPNAVDSAKTSLSDVFHWRVDVAQDLAQSAAHHGRDDNGATGQGGQAEAPRLEELGFRLAELERTAAASGVGAVDADGLRRTIRNQQHAIKSLESERDGLIGRLRDVTDALERGQRSHAALQQEVSSMHERLVHVQCEAEGRREAMRAEVNALRQENESLLEEVEQLESQVTDHSAAEAETLREALKQSNIDLQETKAAHTAMLVELEKVKQSASDATAAEVETLREALKQSNIDLQDTKAAHTAVRAELEQLKQSASDATAAEVDTLREALKQSNIDLQDTKAAHTAALVELEKAKHSPPGPSDSLTKELADARQARDDERTRAKDLQRRLDDATDSVVELEEVVTTSKHKIQDLERANAALETMRQEGEAYVNDLNDEVERLTRELASARQDSAAEISRLRSALEEAHKEAAFNDLIKHDAERALVLEDENSRLQAKLAQLTADASDGRTGALEQRLHELEAELAEARRAKVACADDDSDGELIVEGMDTPKTQKIKDLEAKLHRRSGEDDSSSSDDDDEGYDVLKAKYDMVCSQLQAKSKELDLLRDSRGDERAAEEKENADRIAALTDAKASVERRAHELEDELAEVRAQNAAASFECDILKSELSTEKETATSLQAQLAAANDVVRSRDDDVRTLQTQLELAETTSQQQVAQKDIELNEFSAKASAAHEADEVLIGSLRDQLQQVHAQLQDLQASTAAEMEHSANELATAQQRIAQQDAELNAMAASAAKAVEAELTLIRSRSGSAEAHAAELEVAKAALRDCVQSGARMAEVASDCEQALQMCLQLTEERDEARVDADGAARHVAALQERVGVALTLVRDAGGKLPAWSREYRVHE